MRKNTPLSTNKKPIISIITPMYNAEEFISKSIESVLKQSFKSWEMIIIDDFSSDNSTSIVNRYIAQDSRIKLIKSKENFGGPAKPRNLGIKNAKGSFIAFLDCDDYWSTDKLAICVEYMNDNYDLIYHDMERISNKLQFFGRKFNKTRKLKKSITVDLLLSGNLISNSSTIVRKKVLHKVGLINENRSLIAAEDYNTWLKISILTDLFVYIPKRLGFYFVHEHNISQKNMYKPTKEATKDFVSFLSKKEKLKFKSRLKYLSFNNNYLNSSFRKIKKEFLFILKNGTLNLKIYVLIKIINFYLNKLKKIAQIFL